MMALVERILGSLRDETIVLTLTYDNVTGVVISIRLQNTSEAYPARAQVVGRIPMTTRATGKTTTTATIPAGVLHPPRRRRENEFDEEDWDLGFDLAYFGPDT